MYTSSKPYFYGTGRRKKSVARVRIVPGTGVITINKRDIDEYFGLETLKLIVNQPFGVTETVGKFDIVANVTGGGFSGQAGAIRHGVARALVTADEAYKTLMATKPEKAMELAVKGMLPHNSIGDKSFTRLHVYAGAEHNQVAQQPIAVD